MVFYRTPPHIYEIHTYPWLYQLSKKYNQSITLGNIPEKEIKALADLEIDMVWLMGVWERSPYGTKIAREHVGLQQDYRKALPNYQEEDVVGSPYAVHNYTLIDSNLGNVQELAAFRELLRKYNMGLILDFVPNHVACDHEWVTHHPEYFIQGTLEDLTEKPNYFFKAGTKVLANGRDPYFPAWTDVAQLNAFSKEYRQAAIETLIHISKYGDGVRCDMAMLMTDKVFGNTWNASAGEPLATEFWDEVIQAVRQQAPDFLFVAEVYWNMEAELMAQGFNYCYDKVLYDRLLRENAHSIVAHLMGENAYQNRLVRFIENHDEGRAITAFGEERSLMAAIIVATLPGAKLWHEGQFEGRRIKLPVQLGRRPEENDNRRIFVFYQQLLQQLGKRVYREGEWKLRPLMRAWPENESYQTMLAYTWQYNDKRRLIVVNYHAQRSQGRVSLPDFGIENSVWMLTDILNNKVYERGGDEMAGAGLYIDLQGWSAHIFKFDPA
jgi:glycosidase